MVCLKNVHDGINKTPKWTEKKFPNLWWICRELFDQKRFIEVQAKKQSEESWWPFGAKNTEILPPPIESGASSYLAHDRTWSWASAHLEKTHITSEDRAKAVHLMKGCRDHFFATRDPDVFSQFFRKMDAARGFAENPGDFRFVNELMENLALSAGQVKLYRNMLSLRRTLPAIRFDTLINLIFCTDFEEKAPIHPPKDFPQCCACLKPIPHTDSFCYRCPTCLDYFECRYCYESKSEFGIAHPGPFEVDPMLKILHTMQRYRWWKETERSFFLQDLPRDDILCFDGGGYVEVGSFKHRNTSFR